MAEGTLIVNAKKQIRVRFKNSKDKEVEMAVPDAELSHQLKQESAEKLNGCKVELDEVGGQPKKVRPVGEPFAAVPVQPMRPTQQRGQQGRGQLRGPHRPQERPQQAQQRAAVRGAFHNPYNFVPALPRDRVTGELGDREPLGHHVLHADHYTGVIRVKLTVQTPLLQPDSARAVEDDHGHKSFPVRVDADGKPCIASTSIKGMLRAAYEAVTNSRLAVFPGYEARDERNATGHGARLAFRRPARVEVLPARIENATAQSVTVCILSQVWLKSPAKLPRYQQRSRDRRKGESNAALRYPDNTLPNHGDHVWVKVESNGRVSSIERHTARSAHPGELEGWVLITEPNINSKKFERVFVVSSKDRQLTYQGDAADRLRHLWSELIQDYQHTHTEELEQRRRRHEQPTDYLGDRPGQTAWSRQVWDENYSTLQSGTLCYVRFQNDQIAGLYPVSISRDLYSVSPLALVPESLRPAMSLTLLSPADRVFGWVNQQGKGAYRGNLRIGPVMCESENAIESFGDPGLPLAILGQPKPQQARFYVAQNQEGSAQPNCCLPKEEAGYNVESYPGTKKGLRGRKVYPHHRGLPTDHWTAPQDDQRYRDVATSGQAREYIRHPDSRDGQGRPNRNDNQNRSIQGWVKPNAVFTFDLHVTNLSKVELGALLWLLKLPENHFHRFGGGKPLGFGSVRMEIEWSQLPAGNDWRQVYSTLDDVTPAQADHAALIDEYKQAARTSYGSGGSFEDVPFIAAWLRMAEGHPAPQGKDRPLPTHYPRASQPGQIGPVPPHPEGQAYEWFVANDRTGQNAGPQASLPDLATDSGLPMLPE